MPVRVRPRAPVARASGEVAMRWISVVPILLLVPLLDGCIPIGVRAGTMPYASLGRPFDHHCQVAEATDQHRGDAGEQQGADLKSSEVVDTAQAHQDGHRA